MRILPRKKFEQRVDFKFICAIIIYSGEVAHIYSHGLILQLSPHL